MTADNVVDIPADQDIYGVVFVKTQCSAKHAPLLAHRNVV